MIRVLFGTPGWPSGLLEVGSWAAAQGLAQVVIRQIHPAKLLEWQEAELSGLRPGPLPEELRQRLTEAEVPLPAEGRLAASARGWAVVDPENKPAYYIFVRAGKCQLWDAGRLAWPLCQEAVREYEERLGQKGRFIYSAGPEPMPESVSAELWEALGVVGGAFLERLIRFRPHVIGFRLEGADEDQVAGFIRACRLFSRAEIVLGGPTATSHPVEVLEDLGADYVFAGEAEETFVQFLRLARRPHSRDLAPEIPGLAYRYGGRSYHNTLPTDGYGRTAADTPLPEQKGFPCSPSVGPLTHPKGPERVELGLPSGKKPSATRNQVIADEPGRTSAEVKRTAAATSPRPIAHMASSLDGPELWHRQGWVRPMASSALLEANRLNWRLLEGFDRPLPSLFFTGSRGCPGGCTFCAKLHGDQLRWKSARRLLEEIAEADRCVQAGRLCVERWPLFAHTDRPDLRDQLVSWAAVYDEDFFLIRRRALEFFQLWDKSELKSRYRLSFQTNPRSLMDVQGRVDAELLEWIDRLKPMIQLGGESFHPELLTRWRKRHTVSELERAADALESTHQDYTVFILLSDFDSTPEEVVDAVWLLVRAALRRPGMRIASSPFTIPLYDSQTRRDLEYRGLLPPGRVQSYRDYGRPQPGWMNPWAAQLADLADAELQFALQPAHRDAALLQAMEVLVQTVHRWAEQGSPPLFRQSVGLLYRPSEVPGDPPAAIPQGTMPVGTNRATSAPGLPPWERHIQTYFVSGGPLPPPIPKDRCRLLLQQAEWALEQVREMAFRPLDRPRP